MHYISTTQLPELTAAADRAQRYIDLTLDDLEALPATSIEFRVTTITKVVDAIYRLTAIRKTIIALRANIQLNTAGLQALTANIRSLNAMLETLNGQTTSARNPRLPNDGFTLPADWKMPSLASFYSPDAPPAIDELIPEQRLATPRIPTTATTPVGFRNLLQPSPAELASSIPAQSPATPGSTPISDPDQSSPSSPSCEFPASPTQPATHNPQPGAAIAALQSRFPQSITNPDFKLPDFSTRATDYAPVLKLDLVPQTHCIPTLPFNAENLSTLIDAQLANITDTTINLRADLQPHLPEISTPLNQQDQSDPSDLSDPTANSSAPASPLCIHHLPPLPPKSPP